MFLDRHLALFDGELFLRAIQFHDIHLCLLRTDPLEREQSHKYFKTLWMPPSLWNQTDFLISHLPLRPVFYSLCYCLCPRQMKQVVWKRSNLTCQNNVYFYISKEKKDKLIGKINWFISVPWGRDIRNVKSWIVFDQRHSDANKYVTILYYRQEQEKNKMNVTGYPAVITWRWFDTNQN